MVEWPPAAGGHADRIKSTIKTDQEILLHKPHQSNKTMVKIPFYHTVKYKGEYLYIIAKWYTGDGNNWKKIINANPNLNRALPFGTQIHIPDDLLINKTDFPKKYIGEGDK
ncbi:unnamed protein product [marine sediment metagenome]|uniref:Uncharacterized protein n=1 Tax=marine sediment metagenome TaxID=412755 RepID=X0YB57_9ZZZZ